LPDEGPEMKIETFEAKSIIRQERRSSDIHMNPYQGCYHDCVYCDGKAERYYMHEDYGTRIRVKVNAPAMLEEHLKKKGFLPVNRAKTGTLLDYVPEKKRTFRKERFTINISGGVCDVYQPAEAVVQMSRKLLQIVYDYEFPVFLLTKNKLVLRDIDLLKKINEKARATVCMSISLSDDGMAKLFEPRASTTGERFETLRALHEAGVHTGIWFMPILPWIADSEENIDSVFERARGAGVEYIDCGGLTLKPGRQKEGFFKVIEAHFPELLITYKLLYGNDDKYGAPDRTQIRKLEVADLRARVKGAGERYGMKVWTW